MHASTTGPEATLDRVRLRAAFGRFPSGVVAVCAVVDGSPRGLVASSFTSVSLEPALVSFCIQHTSTTWPQLEQAPRLGVSVLAEGQDLLCRQLAGGAEDRFSGVPTTVQGNGALMLDDAGAWLDCSVIDRVRAGDHDIVIMEVHAVAVEPESRPLIFHASSFHRLHRSLAS